MNFFVVFPLTQVIVVFLAAVVGLATTGTGVGEGVSVTVGVGVGVALTVGVGVGVGVAVTTGAGVYFKVPRFNINVWFGPP